MERKGRKERWRAGGRKGGGREEEKVREGERERERKGGKREGGGREGGRKGEGEEMTCYSWVCHVALHNLKKYSRTSAVLLTVLRYSWFQLLTSHFQALSISAAQLSQSHCYTHN